MRLEIRLLQTLPRPAGEYARAVGVQTEERGDVARRLVLDLRVPQHGLPPLRQRPERLHGQGLLGLVQGPHVRAELQRVVVRTRRHPGRLRGEHREVVDELLPPGRLRPAGRDPADGREQIRAYGVLGPRAAAHRLQHAGEDLGGQIVRGVGVAAAGTGVPAHGIGMAPVQLLVRRVVTRAHPADQLGVGRRQLARRRQDAVLVQLPLGRNPGPLPGTAAGPPWLGTCGRPPASESPSSSDPPRSSTLIAESPRQLPDPF